MVLASTPGNFETSATATGAELDLDRSNNQATYSAVVRPVADLVVRGASSRSVVTTGDRVTYTWTVFNQGPSLATGSFSMKSSRSGRRFSRSMPARGVWPGERPGRRTAWDLPVGATATVTIVVVPTLAGSGPARASVTGEAFDPNPADNLAQASLQVIEPPGTFPIRRVVGRRTRKTQGRPRLRRAAASMAARGVVTVDYYTVPDRIGHDAGVDFIPVSGTLVFEQGETTRTITVPILANPVHHPGMRPIRFVSAARKGAILGSQDAVTTLVIRDDRPGL